MTPQMIIRSAANVEELKTNLKEGKNQIETTTAAMSKIAASLQGDKLIQQAHNVAAAVQQVGGAAKLTVAEQERVNSVVTRALDKYAALGREAPAALKRLAQETAHHPTLLERITTTLGPVGTAMAAAFSTTAVIGAAKKVLDFAGNVTDMSAKLGMSTDWVQKFQLAFEPAGVSLDTVAKATVTLSKNLIEGKQSAVHALTQLGVSASHLKTLAPEQQFLTVADAVGKIQNPAEKAWAATQVFGTGGAELLAGLTGNLQETTDEFDRMGLIIDEKTIKAADDFGDQLGLMGNQLLGIVASVVGPLLPALSALGTALMWIGSKVIGPIVNLAVKSLVTSLGVLWAAIARLLGGLAEMATRVPLIGKHLTGLSSAAEWLRASAAKTTEAITDLWVATDEGTAATKAATPALLGLGAANDDAARLAKEHAEALERLHAKIVKLETGVSGLDRNLNLVNDTTIDALKKYLALKEAIAQVEGHTNAATAGMVSITDALEQVGTQISVVTPHIQSFADVWKTFLKGDFKKVFGDIMSFFKAGAKDIGKGFLRGIGELIASGFASLASRGVSLLIGGLKKLFGSGEWDKVQKMRAEFIKASGGIEALAHAAQQAGVDLSKLFNAKKVKEFEAAVLELQKKLDLQQTAWDKLKAAIDKYQFSIEELGPALGAQMLDEALAALFEDFMLLVGAGVDMAVVLGKMKDEINKYIQIAIKMGLDIPEAWKPILQQMIDLGLLYDENGNLITDLEQSGISFSTSMSKHFKDLIAVLKEMVELLKHALGLTKDITLPDVPPFDESSKDEQGNDVPVFAHGTGGAYVNFGRGTPAILHGRERIMTEAEGRAAALSTAILEQELRELRRDLPRAMKLAVKDALVLAR